MTVHAVRPPIDPQIAQALVDQRDLVVTSMAIADLPGLRARAEPPDLDLVTRGGRFELSHHLAPGPAGAPDVALLLLRPAGAVGPLPVLYHLHGGGLVAGTAYDDLPWATELAEAAGCAVVSCEYRLAPEHPYPAAADDVYAGLVWLVQQADALGLDAQRVVLAGVSAGGGLAAATALAARDRGGPRVLGQLLVCPMLDDRNDSGSAHQMTGHGAWDRTANAVGWGAYLPGRAGTDDVPSTAAAARASDLGGLPPAFVDVGSAETFRDEDVDYARRIWADGGEAELHVWPGGVHGFDFLAPTADLSQTARAARHSWLQRLMARSTVRGVDTAPRPSTFPLVTP